LQNNRRGVRLPAQLQTTETQLNKPVAVIVIAILLGLGFLALALGGTIAGSTKSSSTTSSSNEPYTSSTSVASGNSYNSFYLAMNVIPTNRLVPLGGNTNFTVVLYNGGDLTGNYSLSAVAPSGLSIDSGAIPLAISGAGPHMGVLHVSSSGAMSPGTYQVTIAATGAKGVAHQTFDFNVTRNLVQLTTLLAPYFSNVTVKAGDSVTWEAMDGAMSDESNAFHEVIFSSLNMTSDWIMQYQTWSYTFSHPGTYKYYDRAVPSITGEVVVLP
jgi:plastocyanin